MENGQTILSSSSFEVLGLLGEGAFGKVYLVKKNFLNGLLPRHFALKVFHSVETDVLKVEAETMFKVRSPHCAAVYSIEEFRQGKGLLMEYIEGVSLEELARTYPLSTDERDYLVTQIQAGLQDLFRHGQVHGDLNPRNIMVDKFGRVILVDFGLNNFVSIGSVFGNPAYLSSSRLSGNIPIPSDDIYALDLIYYDLTHNLIGKRGPLWFWEERKAKVNLSLRNKIQNQAKPPKSLLNKLALLLQSRLKSEQTLLCPTEESSKTALRARILVVLLLSGLLSASQASTRLSKNSWLCIRSLSWVQMLLPDGRALSNLDPEIQLASGDYIFRWSKAKKTGNLTLNLKENQHLTLSESDFD